MRLIYPADMINDKMVDEHFTAEASIATDAVPLHREGYFVPRGIADGEIVRGTLLSEFYQ